MTTDIPRLCKETLHILCHTRPKDMQKEMKVIGRQTDKTKRKIAKTLKEKEQEKKKNISEKKKTGERQTFDKKTAKLYLILKSSLLWKIDFGESAWEENHDSGSTPKKKEKKKGEKCQKKQENINK